MPFLAEPAGLPLMARPKSIRPHIDMDRGDLSVVLVGTHPPTACGLATFTANVAVAIAGSGAGWRTRVVRVLDHAEVERSPAVAGHWLSGNPDSLRAALAAAGPIDAVVLQHEYGLFGGCDGEDVLALTRMVDAPLVTVFHTVLSDPQPNQARIMDQLIEHSDSVVLLSECARSRLLAISERAAVNSTKLTTIPHGAARNVGPVPEPGSVPTILTWGLLSPGKGIEHGIRAMALLDPALPTVKYVVAGRTHPKVFDREGERYREHLHGLARSLGVHDQVHFDDDYRDWDSLRALVRSADVVLLPYDSRDQVTSGVLVEALASSKATVATRFPHAVELLAGGTGTVVGHADAPAMARAVTRILFEPGVKAEMEAAAERAAAPLLWPAVGSAYRELISGLVATRHRPAVA